MNLKSNLPKKIILFKSVSPLFEMERDGIKPFTTRKVDNKDKRFRALSQWHYSLNWGIKIINPNTGEFFIRELKSVNYLRWVDWGKPFYASTQVFYDWKILVLGELIP